MLSIQSILSPSQHDPSPDRLQQVLNRLHKRYEHLSLDDRHRQILKAIRRMAVPEPDRQELLRRIG